MGGVWAADFVIQPGTVQQVTANVYTFRLRAYTGDVQVGDQFTVRQFPHAPHAALTCRQDTGN